MLEEDVRAALARVGLEPTSVREIPGGWANFTFDLDGEQIVRFPRTDAVALATQRELRILPELQHVLSFAVPCPSHIGHWHNRPFFAYRRIEGRPAVPADVDDSFMKQAAAALMEGEFNRSSRQVIVGEAAVLVGDVAPSPDGHRPGR